MNRTGFQALMIAFLVALLSANVEAVVSYAIQDLGTLGNLAGGQSAARGVNNAGQVTGQADILNGPDHAFLWTNGTMTDLGALSTGGGSWGQSVNESGQVVGWAAANSGQHGFRYTAGGPMRDIGTLGDSLTSYARGINDYGVVVGYSPTYTSQPHAISWDDGVITDLNDLVSGGSGRRLLNALDINNAGQIVGTLDFSGNNHAFFFDNGYVTDLGTFGGWRSVARRLNENGQIVGESETIGGQVHAFLYDNSTMVDLGTLDGYESSAYGINLGGMIVGTFTTDTDPERAFLYEGSVMKDLNTLIPAESGWELNGAADINDSGQIVGWGVNPLGAEVAFLLTPRITGDSNGDKKVDGVDLAYWQQNYDPMGDNDNTWLMGDWNRDGKINGGDLGLWQLNYDPMGPGITAVPEPATLALLAFGGAALGVCRKRTKKH